MRTQTGAGLDFPSGGPKMIKEATPEDLSAWRQLSTCIT